MSDPIADIDAAYRGWQVAPVYPMLPTRRNHGGFTFALLDASFVKDPSMNRFTAVFAILGFGIMIGYSFGAPPRVRAVAQIMDEAQAWAEAHPEVFDEPPDLDDIAPNKPSMH